MEEKGIAYELIELDLRGNQHRQPDFLAINPFGKLPALVDDGFQGPDGEALRLFESGAILLHLAEHHTGEITSPAQRSLGRTVAVIRECHPGDCTLRTQQSRA